MTILSMTATFGGLENQTLTLRPGLNLLEMPNEGGKSTWCAFIRAMFYGVETRKGREYSEKNRFTPWSGKPMAGTMELLWQGQAITLRRFPKGASPFGGFQAVYTGTEEPVPGLTADNVGQTLLGFGREVFERACFISQGNMAVTQSAELERRLAALATSGEEDVSFSDTEARLRAWRNALQSNRANGSIPQAQARLSQLEAAKRRVKELEESVAECGRTMNRLTEEKTEVEADLARHAARRQADYRQRYEKAKANLSSAQAEYGAVAAIPPAPAVPEPDGLPTAEDELNSYVSRDWTARVFLPLILLGLAVAAVGFGGLIPLLLALPLAALPLLGGAALWLHSRREVKRQREEGLARRQRQWEEACRRREEQERRRLDALSVAQARLDAARLAWDAVSQDGEPDSLSAPPVSFSPPLRSLEEDRAHLARLNAAIAQCDRQRTQALGNMESFGDPLALEEEISSTVSQISSETLRYDALSAAIVSLNSANSTLQRRFAPAVSQLSGQILSKLTANRYDSLTFSRSFEALSALDHPVALLSQGTADQAYLSLRLAICLLALPNSPDTPIILDDALAAFDDARLSLALQVLRDLSNSRQILLFTCHSREAAALAASGLH